MPSIAGLMRAISREGYEVYQLKLQEEITKRAKEVAVTAAYSAQQQEIVNGFIHHDSIREIVQNANRAVIVPTTDQAIDIGKWTKLKLWIQSLPAFSHHTKESYQAALQDRENRLNTPVHQRDDVLKAIPQAHVNMRQKVPLLLADERNGIADAADMSIQEYNAKLIKTVTGCRHEKEAAKEVAKQLLANEFKDSTETAKDWQKRHLTHKLGQIKQFHILLDNAEQPLIIEPSVNRAPVVKPPRTIDQTREEYDAIDTLEIDKRTPVSDQVDQPIQPTGATPNYEYNVPRKAAPNLELPVATPEIFRDPAILEFRAEYREDLAKYQELTGLVEFFPAVERFIDPAVRLSVIEVEQAKPEKPKPQKNESVPAKDIKGRDITGKTTYVDEKGAFILYGKTKNDVVKMYLKNDVPQHVILPPPVSYLDVQQVKPSESPIRRAPTKSHLEESIEPRELPQLPAPVDDFTPKQKKVEKIVVQATIETPDEIPPPPPPLPEEVQDAVDETISQISLEDEFVYEFMKGVNSEDHVWTAHLQALRAQLIQQGRDEASTVDLEDKDIKSILDTFKMDYFDIKTQLQLQKLQDDQEAYAQTLPKFYFIEGYYNTLRERLFEQEPVQLSSRGQTFCQKAGLQVSFQSPEMVRAVIHQRHNLLVANKHEEYIERFDFDADLKEVRRQASNQIKHFEFESDDEQMSAFTYFRDELSKTKDVIKRLQTICAELTATDKTYSTLRRVDKTETSNEKLLMRWEKDLAVLKAYEAHLTGSMIGFAKNK